MYSCQAYGLSSFGKPPRSKLRGFPSGMIVLGAAAPKPPPAIPPPSKLGGILAILRESLTPTYTALGLVQVGVFLLKSAPGVRKARADPRRIGSAQAQPPIPRAFRSDAANDGP